MLRNYKVSTVADGIRKNAKKLQGPYHGRWHKKECSETTRSVQWQMALERMPRNYKVRIVADGIRKNAQKLQGRYSGR